MRPGALRGRARGAAAFRPFAAAALLGGALAASVLPAAAPARSAPLAGLDALYPSLDALYLDLHRNPELSLAETRTAGVLAARLRSWGYGVTERVGGTGVVAVLRNGNGPTLLVRTDMDALPMPERTGLPYASAASARNASGETVPVSHACGHDVHMTSWAGAAALLARERSAWRGTLVFVGQPAEETLKGAAAMVADGLFTRFPKPDAVLGLHVTNLLPAGSVGVAPGPASAASNAVDVTFYGRGGHGASPHRTIDPVLMAARAVVALQAIVSREVSPFDPAVVTVGTIHAGTKRNIVPDEARIELTVRSFRPEVQKHLVEAIARVAKAEAAASGAERDPQVVVDAREASEVVVNDPALSARLAAALRKGLGEEKVGTVEPASSSEDFGVYGRVAGAPSVQLRIGATPPGLLARSRAEGTFVPGPHSSLFAPDREPTIRAGVAALVVSALEVLGPADPSRR